MISVNKVKSGFFLKERDFQSLNSKGYGTKVGSKFELNLFEVVYLMEKNRVKIDGFSVEDLMKLKNFDYNSYLVFKDLRSKGFIVKSGLKYGFVFRVYDRGVKVGEDHSLWLVDVMSEKDKMKVKDIAGHNRVAHTAKKKMLFAIVDDEGGVTYIENSWKRV